LCQLSLCSSLLSYPVNFTDNEHFTGIEHSDLKGKLSSELTYITIALRGDDALELEVNCSMPDNSDSSAPKGQLRRRPGLSTQCSLDIIIYGPMELFDDIGSFFEEYDIYLQDPVNCKRNVRYCNPQRLSVDPSAVKFTSELGSQVAHAVVINDLETRPEFLDILCSQQDLAETAQPGPIRTVLRRFRNTISGAYQMQEPDQFYGGIVADPMGLGKSLSMIALIACDVHPHDNDPSSRPAVDREESSGQTLVIVPPPLLSTWEGQLKEHVFTNNLPWRRYHGKGRLRDSSELSDTLIVLTTYHTVMTEWRSVEERNQSILFKTKWKRIILDEAHFIRNSESQMSRAICSLESVSRWAVTGTPIQNKLGDLSALLKFLRISPYSEKRAFDADISNLWKSGNIDKAVERLKRLSSCLLLRRPKETIQLPTKHDYTYTVEFTTAERQLYEDVRSQAIAHIDEALHLRDSSTRSHSFFNVLQRIEAMRMVCNLGLHYPSRHEVLSGRQNTEDDWQVEAQRVFNLQRDMGQIQCQDCGFSADAAGDPFFESGRPRVSHLFSRCLKFLCSSCSLHYSDPNRIVLCEHNNPRCPISTVLMDVDSEEPPSSLPGSLIHRLPSKVEMLLDDLKKQPIDVKSVVFSSWKMTLNIVDAGLKNSSIPSLRYDGSVAQKDRQGVIDRFGNDPSIRVLLLTLTCGAVGLTLTEASRAYLMEPHWNPTLEDQALARIHRIGQTREVTTIRFSVQNSFEEVSAILKM
ncbi:SNF2 family N-terminal domain-containing protein, partial [Ilyonectria sp. MPI-CAGE-AT-0026]